MIQESPQNLLVLLVRSKEALLSFYRPILKEYGLTEQQWRVIHLLAEAKQLDFQVLAEKACLLRPSLTGILNRLEAMQLTVRRKPAVDQRKLLIELSSKGIQTHDAMIAHIQKAEATFNQLLGEKNQTSLLRLLHKTITIKPKD